MSIRPPAEPQPPYLGADGHEIARYLEGWLEARGWTDADRRVAVELWRLFE